MPDEASADEPATAPPSGNGSFLGFQMRVALATLLLVALLGLGSVPLLLSNPAWLSQQIARAVPELQAEVLIGRARIGWFGPVVLEDLKVVPRDGTTQPLKVRRIEGSHGLAAILASWGDLGRVRISGLEGHLAFDAARRSNLQTLFAPRPTGPDRADRGPRRSPVRMRLETDDAVVRISGPWTPEPWVSEPIAVRAALGPTADGTASAWTIEPVDILTDARMEPAVAQGVLAYIAPVLADATRTGGRFSLHLDGGRFPVGDPQGATLSGVLAMHEVVLGPGPLVLGIFESLPGRLPAPPTIRIADESHVVFRLEQRRVWHEGLEFGLPLAKPGQRLDVASSGSVNLDDGALDVVLQLPIPHDLPQDRPLLASLAGKSISLGLGGKLGEPRIDFNGSIRATAGAVVTELVDRLRGTAPPRPQPAPPQPAPPQTTPPQPPVNPRQPRRFPEPQPPMTAEPATAPPASATPADPAPDVTPAGGQPSADAVIDLVGGVLDELAKRRAERQSAAQEDPDGAAPPRIGGRLRGRLRRLLPPPAGDPAPATEPAP